MASPEGHTMKDPGPEPKGDVRPDGVLHEEFLELCALATSGTLTSEERDKLDAHLAVCSECFRAMSEFEGIAGGGIAALASALAPEFTGTAPKENASFSLEAAERAFLKRLSEEKKRSLNPFAGGNGWPAPLAVRRSRSFRQRYDAWVPLAATILLCGSLGMLAYRMGEHRGVLVAESEERKAGPETTVTADALQAAIRDREGANAQVAKQDKLISDLRQALDKQSNEMRSLKSAEASQDAALAGGEGQKKELIAERDRLTEQADAAQTALKAAENKLQNLERQRNEDAIHAASLEAEVADLSRRVSEQQQNMSAGQELLAKDRDIRELMGARDLYITEVYDIAKTGETQKPFGRLFYTKGKSLIFYAYDLKEGPGAQEANAFQAWGRRGADWNQAYNLGMFYEDNAAKRRWVLKFNDRKALDQIDAVFVTVEPNGGSERPTGKPLLFAYLKVNANHP